MTTSGLGTTLYLNGLWEEDLWRDYRRSLYYLNGQVVAQREGSVLYLHGDHLGSVSVTTDASGATVSGQDFTPFGTVRRGGVGQTTLNFTGQHRDGTGLLFYNARYYDPALGKFLSPDTIVPGTASGTGGGAATLGYDDRVALAPLTVAFHEPDFLAGLNAEHRFTQANGFWFQLSAGAKSQTKVGWGPANPQALNRYAYVLNNPVRYTDPTGHCGPQCGVAATVGGMVCGPICAAAAVAVVAALSAVAAAVFITEIAGGITVQASGKQLVPGDPQLDVHLDRIDRTQQFIDDHPDIRKDAEAERQGNSPNQGRNHATEARHWINSLDKAIAQLIRKYREYDADGQSKILDAINRTKAYRQRLQDELDGK